MRDKSKTVPKERQEYCQFELEFAYVMTKLTVLGQNVTDKMVRTKWYGLNHELIKQSAPTGNMIFFINPAFI